MLNATCSRMATILFAWELGAGFGHLAPYRTLAETLSDAGHRVIFAVQNVARAESILGQKKLTCVQAPVNIYCPHNVNLEPATFSDILSIHGYADPISLASLVS